MRLKRHTIINSWVLSYMLILLLAAAAAIFAYSRAISYARQEVEKVYQSQVDQMQYAMDKSLLEMRRIALELSNNYEVTLLFNSRILTDEEHYSFYQIQKGLHNYAVTNTDIYETAVCYRGLDMAVSNRSTYNLNDILEKTGCREQIQKAMETGETETYFIASPGGKPAIFYMLFLPLEAKSEHNSYILIQQNSLFPEKAVAPPHGSVLKMQVDGGALNIGDSWPQGDSPLENCRLLTKESTLTGIFYSLYIEKPEFERSVDKVNTAAVLCLVIGGLMCVVVLFVSIRRNYTPISRLLKAVDFPLEESPDHFKNEFEYIYAKLMSIQDKNVNLEKAICQTRKNQQDVRLSRLLAGDLPLQEQKQAEKEMAAPSAYAVMGIHPLDCMKLFHQKKEKATQEKNYYLLQYITANILSDYTTETLNIYSTAMNGSYYSLFCGEEAEIQKVFSQAEHLVSLLYSIFNVEVRIGLSGYGKDFYGVAALCSQAREALEYCKVFERPTAYYQQAEAGTARNASMALEFAQASRSLCNAVTAGDMDSAQECLEKAFVYCADKDMPVTQTKMLMAYIEKLFCDGIFDYHRRHAQLAYRPDEIRERLSRCAGVKQLSGEMKGILNEIREALAKSSRLERDDLKELLLRYIESNYGDCNLNASSVAAAFEMTVSSTEVRIRHAKELLLKGEHTVTQVAKLVGYNDSSTFIRNFKKCEGVSPGKYSQ